MYKEAIQVTFLQFQDELLISTNKGVKMAVFDNMAHKINSYVLGSLLNPVSACF